MKTFNERLWSKEIYNKFIDFTNQPNYWIPIFDPKKDPAVIAAKKLMDAIEDKESDSYKSAKLVYDATVKAADSSNLLTQEKVNAILAEEKKKSQKAHQDTLDQLKALKKQANLTSEERSELEKKIETIESTLKTEEQLAAENAKKAENRHKKELGSMEEKKTKWKTRYTNSTIDGALRDACEVEGQKAYYPKQVLAILRPDTHLIEALDKDGKPTGDLVPQVKFKDQKDGKSITLDLSVNDAVKRMSEMKEHANLFAGKGTGGPGLHRDRQDTGNLKELAKDTKAYREARKDGSLTLEE